MNIWGRLRGFIDIKHSIKAQIFVGITAVMLIIMIAISIYWYNLSVKSTFVSIEENTYSNLNTSLTLIENAFFDIRKMHTTLVYETGSFSYINNDYNIPDQQWFQEYNATLEYMRAMKFNLSRTISGIGIYKPNRETCVTGTISITGSIYNQADIQGTLGTSGNDVIFYLDKPAGLDMGSVDKYIFVGKNIIVNGKEKAILITKLNEDMIKTSIEPYIHKGGYILLIDPEGNILYDSSPGVHEAAKDKSVVNSMLNSNNRYIRNKEFVTFFSTSEELGMTLVFAVPLSYVHQMNILIRYQLLFLMIIVLLITSVFSVILSNKITSGLQRLSEAMKEVGKGAKVRVKKLQSQDEIGVLSDVFSNMVIEIQQLMDNIRNNEIQKRDMEIKILRAQVSPHFLYNSLNTINYLAILQNVDNIKTITSSLIDLLQGAVNIDDQLITLEEELHFVKSYINIQQYRQPYRIQTDYQVGPDELKNKVPRMIVQPIVENAIIHGLSDKKSDSRITINAYQKNNNMHIYVTDNGIGMAKELVNDIMTGNVKGHLHFSGIGINNVNDRIKMQLGQEYGIHISSEVDVFTTVELKLPIIKECG